MSTITDEVKDEQPKKRGPGRPPKNAEAPKTDVKTTDKQESIEDTQRKALRMATEILETQRKMDEEFNKNIISKDEHAWLQLFAGIASTHNGVGPGAIPSIAAYTDRALEEFKKRKF